MKKVLLILAMAMMFFACGAKGSKGSTFSLNLGAEPKSIDPQLSTDIAGGTVNELLSEGLLKRTPDGKPDPGIAEKWEVSPDGLKWTFHLRDAKWSNGDPITANDFKAAWIRGLDPKVASEYAYMLYPIKNGELFNKGKVTADKVGIKVVDPKTLEVTLESPTPYFADLVTFKTYSPINEKFLKEAGEKFATEANQTISSGPYVMKKWVHDSEIKFEKNPNYWNKDNVKVDNITYKLIPDNSAALNAFKNKEVQVTNITAEQAREYEGKPELVKSKDGSVWYILPNLKNKFLSNSKIRKAILLAVDRDELVKSVLNGTGESARTFVPSGIGIKGISKDFPEEVPTSIEKYNPQKAKQLFAEGLKELGMTSAPTLEVLINDSGNNKPVAEFVQESVRKNLGLNLNVKAVTFQERVSRMASKDFDLVLAGWSGDFKDPITYLDLFVTGGGQNRGSYSNPQYDALVKKIKSTADPNVRVPAMIELEKIIADDTPVAVLFQREKPYLMDTKVQGLKFTAIGGEFYFKNLSMK